MLKKFLPYLFLVPTLTMAQPTVIDRKMVCNRTELVLAEIALSELKQTPIWIGDAKKDTKLAIVANPETKTWTVIIYNDTVTCLVLYGEGYQLFTKPIETK